MYYDDVDKQYSSKNPFRKPPQPITTISERFISDCESVFNTAMIGLNKDIKYFRKNVEKRIL